MQWSIQRGFMQFVNEVENDGIPRLIRVLEQEYAAVGSWDSLRSEPQRWRRLVAAALYSDAIRDFTLSPEGTAPPQGMLPPHIASQFDRRLLLADAGNLVIIGEGQMSDAQVFQINRSGEIVGYLGLLPQRQPSGAAQQNFLQQQHRTLLMAAGIVIGISALFSLFIARRIVRPLKELAKGTQRLASGDYQIRVPALSHDELGELARYFNTMAQTLADNEQSRCQWVADISHELRTPLTFLRSQVEALQDGIRQPTAESLQALHREISRLGGLVDDLHQLSLADMGTETYHKEDIDAVKLLRDVVAGGSATADSRGISVFFDAPENHQVMIYADARRVSQLFANLLDNSLVHTDSGGNVRITICSNSTHAIVDVHDTAPGVPDEDLKKLFDRLYRVDASRSRATGGSGLGLSICRAIVAGHDGKISVHHSPAGGLWVRVELPMQEHQP